MKFSSLILATCCALTLPACLTDKEKLNSVVSQTPTHRVNQIDEDTVMNDPQWVADRKHLSSSEISCEEIWSIVWKWAKAGNLEAKAYLTSMIFSGFGMPIEGRSSVYDPHQFAIMGLYSLGYNQDNAQFNWELSKMLYDYFSSLKPLPDESFLSCLKDAPSQQCLDIAVKKRIVISFEEFSKSIDVAMASGQKPVCPKKIKTIVGNLYLK